MQAARTAREKSPNVRVRVFSERDIGSNPDKVDFFYIANYFPVH